MGSLFDEIAESDREQISELLEAVLQRHTQVYPEWEIMTVTLNKRKDRKEQIRDMIEVLLKLAEG